MEPLDSESYHLVTMMMTMTMMLMIITIIMIVVYESGDDIDEILSGRR